jgi:hypothetical protein
MALATSLVVTSSQLIASAAPAPAITPDDAFDNVWRTTDAAVAGGVAGYSWFWGPTANDELSEPYRETPGGQRVVRYYDKSRMEITHPDGDPTSIWYVTNGLLTVELLSGERQLGDSQFESLSPSSAKVAGDPENNPGTPTYAEFAPYATTNGQTNRATDRTGQAVTDYLSGTGGVTIGDPRGATLASYQPATGHNIANVFWEWASDPGSGFRPADGVDWLYVLGYPITEPYWIDATVAGTARPVLVQLFQRRVLTYDATNPAAYRVEFGNIGQHYHAWLYGGDTPPTEGGALYSWSLSDWPEQQTDVGSAFLAGGTYHQRVNADGEAEQAPAIYSYLSDFERADLGAHIRVRLDTPEAHDSEACLVVRVAADGPRDYAWCINGRGETDAIFEDNGPGGAGVSILLGYVTRDGTLPPTEWNELAVIASGDHLWFLINGAVVGDARHDWPADGGSVGFYTINFDASTVEYEWDALTVFAIE